MPEPSSLTSEGMMSDRILCRFRLVRPVVLALRMEVTVAGCAEHGLSAFWDQALAELSTFCGAKPELRSETKLQKRPKPAWILAPRPGLEPGTCRLTVRRLHRSETQAGRGIPHLRLGIFQGTSGDLWPLTVRASPVNRPSQDGLFSATLAIVWSG